MATDGPRLARVEMPLPEGAEKIPGVIVPRKMVGEVRKLLEEVDGAVEVSLSDTRVRFAFDDAERFRTERRICALDSASDDVAAARRIDQHVVSGNLHAIERDVGSAQLVNGLVIENVHAARRAIDDEHGDPIG